MVTVSNELRIKTKKITYKN